MKYDCCLVLSHELKEDKTLSEETRQRLESAIRLYFSNETNKIIVSGNYKNVYGISLAEAMEKYAIDKGVKKSDIIKEEISLETVGQLIFCKMGILEIKKWFNLIIISSDYHITRLKTISKTIFDKKYKIDFLGAESNINSDLKVKAEEIKSKDLFIKTFGNDVLNNEGLLRILFEKHNRYNTNPKHFLKELEVLKKSS
jgi:uncharacterized SAM-binding protein YcdF (DUF218 family)